MNKVTLASLVCLMLAPTVAFAKGAPELGSAKAFAHQLCGKDISLQIANTTDGFTVLGLQNKTTGVLDLFVSSVPFDISGSYSQFKPVKFDNLSKELIETGDKDIDIVWGASQDANQKTRHRLALGNYTYECASIVAWPNDKANDLYGEPPVNESAKEENKTVTATESKEPKQEPAVKKEKILKPEPIVKSETNVAAKPKA